MTKYVATDVLQRLKAHIGVVSNWFKGLSPLMLMILMIMLLLW